MPRWSHWVLAAVALAAAAYHLWHLRRHGDRAVDLTHAAMGAAMAVMFVAGIGGTERRWALAAFVAALVWFVASALRSYVHAGGTTPYLARQAACCAVMVGMLALSARPAGGHHHHAMTGGPGPSLLAALIAGIVVVGWTVRDLVPAHDGRLHQGAQLATSAGSLAMLAMLL